MPDDDAPRTTDPEPTSRAPADATDDADAALSETPTSPVESKDERKRFIPIRRRDVERMLLRESTLSEEDKKKFHAFALLQKALVHYDFHHLSEVLKDTYAPYAPSGDTELLEEDGDEVSHIRLLRFLDTFSDVLDYANFEALSVDELNAIMASKTTWGIQFVVDRRDYDELSVWARGESEIVRKLWQPFKRFFGRTVHRIPTFRRVVILIRLRRDDDVLIKVFRDIPREDLEMLFPNTRPRLRLFDRLQVGTALGAAIASGVSLFFKLAAVAVLGLTVPPAAIVGAVALIIGGRTWAKYRTLRQKYFVTLTKSLYHLNLDNNRGAIQHLVDLAEDEECKESLLAYYFLLTEPDKKHDAKSLDLRVEEWLRERFGVSVDFEIADALRKLVDKDLLAGDVVDLNGGAPLVALPLEDALVRLDYLWDNVFLYNNNHNNDTDSGGEAKRDLLGS